MYIPKHVFFCQVDFATRFNFKNSASVLVVIMDKIDTTSYVNTSFVEF